MQVHTDDAQYLANLTPEEHNKFGKFKELVDPENKRTSRVLLRFLNLSKFDIDRAAAAFRQFDKMWSEIKEAPDDLTKQELATRKVLFGGLDSRGRRIVQFHYKLHDPSKFPPSSTLKLFLLMMDVALDCETTQKAGMVYICWMEGSGWSNFDLASEKVYADCVYSFAPLSYEMMGKMILVDSPWYVWAVMKIMSPFITPELRSRLHFA
jgi:hypothetical protein